jgi:hypothetical protein
MVPSKSKTTISPSEREYQSAERSPGRGIND